MKKAIFLFLIIILLSGCGNKNEIKKIKINNKVIKVELAKTANEKQQGLSNIEKLCDDCGMLFIFDEKDLRFFWMKDMKFSIDMIWIDDDKIVNITKNADLPQGENIPTYSSDKKVNYVLEVNANFCEDNNIKVNDKILFLWKK